MKTGDEHKLDRLFKNGLSKPEDHVTYRNEDWEAMEELLDKPKRRGIIFSMPVILSSAAAVLLLAFGLFLITNKTPVKKHILITKVKLKPQTSKNGQSIQQIPTQTAPSKHVAAMAKLVKRFPVIISKKSTKREINALPDYGTGPYVAVKDTTSPKKVKNNAQPQVFASNDSTSSGQPQQTALLASEIAAATTIPADSLATLLSVERKKKVRSTNTFRHPISLSIIAAPDFNGVGSAFNRTQIGTNAGLLLSVGITNKITMSTGAVYAKKPYTIGFSQYNYASDYKFSVNPIDVMADCRVLDIPLNINYQVYSRGINQLSIGTGLSSYFMLSERYSYTYPGNTIGAGDIEIKNQNKHLFGVININATYQRRINSKFGLNVQPYMKLPLTNIGYGRVNLKSTGVAFGASWYLNTSRAKK
ncbi:hypothetical protein MUGA111182_00130 [Mucilaginibacter galii]|uniref:Outer membrane protein beta-barrel domain-containing protein n=1 Tax=Mucilaginibacter galii TaxID=2005073 RepID=A0A917J771_9SPHI|nr:hypothetical protein [Mucilaginibacter galii]GGI49140.1 hypothetical protein GCM10011425_03520 [Mucilaginibacter galii]